MKWLFVTVVLASCLFLGMALIFIDLGHVSFAIGCALLSIIGFFASYRMQSHYILLDDI